MGLKHSYKFCWSVHVIALLKRIGSMSDIMKKLMYDMDLSSFKRTYFVFVRPKLEYASHIWKNCTQQDCNKLEYFQLDIDRIVTLLELF